MWSVSLPILSLHSCHAVPPPPINDARTLALQTAPSSEWSRKPSYREHHFIITTGHSYHLPIPHGSSQSVVPIGQRPVKVLWV
ncbi:hypothetical protein FPQ18DRAFT_335015 [Pyronema domesticum]|nr:hypothetical protein FPQ18DRAFT_335015 [Pyronema domesticum]